MNPRDLKRLSHYLSRVLRHQPRQAGLTLDPRGFAPLDVLARAAAQSLGLPLTRADLELLTDGPLAPDQKRRFEREGDFIRAGHGHSIPVVGYRAICPDPPLYHATVSRFLDAIRAEGLRAMARQKVHLSHERAITVEAARRRVRAGEKVVLLEIDLAPTLQRGIGFYASADPRIVLSDDIPADVLREVL